MLDFLPNPVAIQLGPLPVYWYGIGYAVGLAVAYLVMVRLARRAGEDADILGNGMIIVAVAALIGGRAYHVIDQWALYQDDPIKIFLPPYSGLGVYGGIVTGTIAAFAYARYKKVPFLRWADIIAPGLFVMQAIARWGNFFNQELYGPPTTLPWGIPIDCAHRVAAYACPPGSAPTDTLGELFHPLFLYESISGTLGALLLIWLGYHARNRLRPGDLLLTFFVWYGTTRFVLETLRADNWTFFGVPTAQIVSLLFIIPALVILFWRHRAGHTDDLPATHPDGQTWGAPGSAVEPDELDDDEDEDDDDDWEDDDEDEAEDGEDDDTDADGTDAEVLDVEALNPAVPVAAVPVSSGPEADAGASAPDEPDDAESRPKSGTDRDLTMTTPDDRAGSGRRRPPPGRIAPEALAAQRGGAIEGLQWLGRPPEAKASLLYRLMRLVARFVIFGLFRFHVRTTGQEHLPSGGYFLVAAAHRGWLDPFVVMHAIPSEPRAWFLGSAPSTFTSRWRERLIHRLGGLLPVWRGGIGIDQHIEAARAVIANGAVFAQMPEGTVSGPPGRIGQFRTGWAVIALRVDAPIVPLAMAGTEELYLGRRIASRVLPVTSARALAGLAPGTALPEPGSREELALAREMSQALMSIIGPIVEELYPWTVDPPEHKRRWRKRLTWLLLRPGRLDRDV